MGVIAEGILRGCQGLSTPVSLGYPLSVFNKNSTLNQRDENSYQLNNIGCIDDFSIFADTPESMQKLLNVVLEFTAWCGMQNNVKNVFVGNR